VSTVASIDREDLHDDGEGPAVVLLHSSMSSKGQWKRLVRRLRDRYRTMSIDLAGYGTAPMPPCPDEFTLAEEAGRVEAMLLARLGGRPYHLVGHSYGGAVALRLAWTSPHRVSSLTLFEPVSFHLLPPRDPALAEVDAVAADVARGVADGSFIDATRRFIDFWNGRGEFARLDPRLQDALARLLPKTMLDFQAIARETAGPSKLEGLRFPTALIGGRQSPHCVHAVLQALARAMPRAGPAWVRGGHMAPLTAPALVDPLIEAFLDLVANEVSHQDIELAA